jgi:TonB family protein
MNHTMRNLIIASLLFLFISVGGVVGYLYFIAEPKRHPDEPAISSEPQTSKSADSDQQVPLPDAAPSQSSQPQQPKQQAPPSDTGTSKQEKQEVPEPKPPDVIVDPIDMVKPVLIHRVNPEYPEIARKSRIQGVVILEAKVTREGIVENVKVIRGLHPILDQAAMKAVRQWRYKPATLNGKPMNAHFTISVKFKLK